MAEKNSSVATSGPAADYQKTADEWKDVVPKAVNSEDAMNEKEVAKTWAKIYRAVGGKQMNEKSQRAVRLAIYVYAALNGTSREGDYKAEIETSEGVTFSASVIPKATGTHAIRRFFRGCMKESYKALKSSGALEHQERFIAKAAAMGIPATEAFAIADWLNGCPDMTPAERRASDTAFNYGIKRARGARNGRSLEDVEKGRVDAELEAQSGIADDRSAGAVHF